MDVLRRIGLRTALGKLALEGGGVDAVHDDQFRYQIRPPDGQRIGDRGPPVMAQQDHGVVPDQRRHIRHQLRCLILLYLGGSPALPIAALVGGNAVEPLGQQRGQIVPRARILGKAMQHQQLGRVLMAPVADKERIAVDPAGFGPMGGHVVFLFGLSGAGPAGKCSSRSPAAEPGAKPGQSAPSSIPAVSSPRRCIPMKAAA